MTIEAIKKKARGHEQNEEWQKALDLYLQAIDKIEYEEDPDISLFNRVGDLELRVGKVDDAVRHYERAADLYMESELPNNAIAICKKVMRSLPNRASIYLKMGQIRAAQGFIRDARQNFLTYAEMKQSEGDIEAALDALLEFVKVDPEDTEIRLALAGQLAQHDRVEEAVNQYRDAYTRLILQDEDEKAQQAANSAMELDPTVELQDPEEIRAAGPEALGVGAGGEGGAGLPGLDGAPGGAGGGEGTAGAGSGGGRDFKITRSEPFRGREEEEEAEPLPFMHFGDEDEEEEVEAPGAMEFDAEPPGLQEAEPPAPEEPEPPALAEAEPTGAEEAREEALEEAAAELREEAVAGGHEAMAAAGKVDEAIEALEAEIDARPEDLELRQRLVEYAFRTNDDDTLVSAYLGLAETLRRQGSDQRAEAIYKQVLDTDPENQDAQRALIELSGKKEEEAPTAEVASSEEYVDLGAMIFDEEDEEKTTRFRVPAEAPSGDEDADFAKMLDQFKEKVARNVPEDDVTAHYDLGTAYKEMGLIDEAIAEFQSALRARRDHLPTYEMLGQCFLEQGKHEVAIRTLKKGLEAPHEIEDELMGIYYYLGRAYEDLDDHDTAKDYYEKVFGLDINFQDVTERLRALR